MLSTHLSLNNVSVARRGQKWQKVELNPRTVQVEPPRGTHQARVDEKGRLKLPAVFLEYLKGLGESRVFITSLDTVTARLYPISLWKQNEILLEGADEDSEASEDIALIANLYGDESEVDAQGRVLVPTTLRRHLAIENQTVWLDSHKGRINICSDAVFEDRKRRAMQNAVDKLKQLEKKGLK